MTTQEYLKQAVRFERMTRNKLLDIARYKEMAISTSIEPKTDIIQSSGNKDKLGTIVAKMVDLEREVDSLVAKRDKIIRQIESMENSDQYQVLYSCYIENDNLQEIGRLLHYSKTQIYRVKDSALENFEKKYGKEYLES